MIKLGLIFALGMALTPTFSRIKKWFSRPPQSVTQEQLSQEELSQGVSFIRLANCPICLEGQDVEGNKQIVLLPCGHAFHRDCIDESFRHSTECPLCCAHFTSNQYIYLSPNAVDAQAQQPAAANQVIDQLAPHAAPVRHSVVPTVLGITSGLAGIYLARKFWPNPN